MWLASTSLQLVPAKEIAAVLGLSTALPILRWALNFIIFKPLAQWLLLPESMHKTGLVPDKFKARVSKLTESQWKFFCYTTFAIMGLLATWHQPWLRDTTQYWAGWPHQQLSTMMRALYACELGYYIATIVMLAFWEVPRKDFGVMMMHHCATVVLITFSYKYNYTRVGCVIMLLHDINDVLMEVAKMFNYCDREAISTAFFAAFMVSWAVLRLGAFPVYIINSTMFEVKQVLGFKPPYYTMFNCLLVGLFLIHLYWFHLILRVAYIKLKTGYARDVREDNEDD